MIHPTPISIKATGITLNDALRTYVDKKLAKIERFLNQNDTTVIANIEIGKVVGDQRSGDIFFAEINLEIGGTLLRSVCKKDDLHAAIDCMQDEIIRELKKFKGKKDALYKRGARRFKQFIHGFRE